MQPYFAPYAGYFRLFAATDVFVVYDCVQFPRRGWVHRNRLTAKGGEQDWLTLPLRKAPQNVLIKDLEFAPDVEFRFANEASRFNVFETDSPILTGAFNFRRKPLEYVSEILRTCCDTLGLHFNVVYSSSLNISANVRAEERIIAICEAVGATHYVNSPGGRNLYCASTFESRGIKLKFLSEYSGVTTSILERLVLETPSAIFSEILSQSDC